MFNLKIYNTLSGKKEIFKPFKGKRVHPVKYGKAVISPKAKSFNRVNLFVCGPTVYDFSHIGHARTYIIFDCFTKYLRHLGFDVFYLQNITDVDDKIISRAREKEVAPKYLAEVFLKEYLKDMKFLGIDSVNKYAKATSYIKEIISQIQRLMDKGYAYRLDDGIYFDILQFKEYGKLSGRTALQAEDSTSRIDYSKDKKNRGDFCLWKFNEHRHEPSWPSPFGKGRPGWHIEDTAITEKFFGPQYDIHGGGRDLMFPHHEAEITQMEAISGKKPMAKYWLHTGFLTLSNQKMSKSLNNFVLIRDFLKRNERKHLRFWVAKNLWRSPFDYSESAIMESKVSLERIEEFVRKVLAVKSSRVAVSLKTKVNVRKYRENFYKNLDDDFNTPKAFAVVFDLIKDVNKQEPISKKDASGLYEFFEEINEIFGIINFKYLKQVAIPKEIKNLLLKREEYRKAGEWEKADQARLEIEKRGYLIEDTKEGPVLKKK